MIVDSLCVYAVRYEFSRLLFIWFWKSRDLCTFFHLLYGNATYFNRIFLVFAFLSVSLSLVLRFEINIFLSFLPVHKDFLS